MTVLEIDSGNTAWILTSATLVLLMTPGLALFYGGMVRAKSVLNMMMMSFGALASISVIWVLWGYSLAFGDDVGYGLLGNPGQYFGLKGLMEDTDAGLPAMAFVGFQAVFAIITVALISGAIADRAKFSTWMIFTVIWATIVYFPVAHWVFDFSLDAHVGGWIANNLKAIDFAGGTAVHINAGAAALALALVLGKSRSFGKGPKPHSVPLTLLGAGLLWAGWYAFNGGSWLSAADGAAFAMVTSFLATCAATLAWLTVEKMKDGHVTGIGAASGAIAGLVAITPSCGDVTPIGAIVVGLIAGAVCPLAVGLKDRFGYDDSLDVVGVHLVGGVIGTLLIGIVGSSDSVQGIDGLFYGGGFDQLWRQFVAAAAVLAYSFVVSLVLALILKATMGLRIPAEAEEQGIDSSLHRDPAYELV